MLFRIIFFFIATLIAFKVHSEAPETFQLDGLTEPSAFINGCVNAINGAYVTSSQDIIVDGPEPIVFNRQLNTSIRLNRITTIGFSHNHPTGLMQYGKIGGRGDHIYASLPFGDSINLTAKQGKKSVKEYTISPLQLENGVTNTSSFGISAKTNIRNYKAKIKNANHKGKTENCILVLGDGTKKEYKKVGSLYVLSQQIFPSGNRLIYEHDDSDEKRLKRIFCTDPSGNTTFNWINFNYSNADIKITASNGRRAHYNTVEFIHHFQRLGPGHSLCEKRKFISNSKTTGIPKTNYHFKEDVEHHGGFDFDETVDRNQILTAIEGEEGRHIWIERDASKKVSSLSMPNQKGTPEKIVSIEYHPKESFTVAKDPCGGQTAFHYDQKTHRLESKVRYATNKKGKNSAYSSYCFFWGKAPKQYKEDSPIEGVEGNLITKAIADSHENLLTLVNYIYDNKGNVLKETIVGHLTGEVEPSPISLNKKYIPILDQHESFCREYTYTDDDFNLALTEREEDGLTKVWEYLPNTNKPTQKLLYARDKIIQREFYQYNALRMPIKTITDDGNGISEEDLTGVTERIIVEVTPNLSPNSYGIGKPLSIQKRYLNLNTGEESLLSRIDYTYGIYDLVQSETHFDADNQLRYTLQYKYDNSCNCIESTDPIGRTTIKKYNKDNQCTYSEILGSGFFESRTYDPRGRLSQTVEEHKTGERFVRKFSYDALDRKVSETDAFGNITYFYYDQLGRLEKVKQPSYAGKDQLITLEQCKKFNIWDQAIEEIDALGNHTKKSFNSRGQPTFIQYPDGTSETFRYNLNGTVNKKIAKNGTIVLFHYDDQRRAILEESYSASGLLLKQKQSIYEGKQLKSEIDAIGCIAEYGYDGAGRKISMVRHGGPEQVREAYEYDSAGRLFAKLKWFDIGENDFIKSVEIFDNLDRKIDEWTEDAQGIKYRRISYEYDFNGNQNKKIVWENDDSYSVYKTIYNSYNQPIKKINPLNQINHCSYNFQFLNNHGQKVLQTTETDPKGMQTIVTKDVLGKDACIQKKNPFGVILSSESMYYDPRGLKTVHIVDVMNNGNKIREYEVAWEFDSMGRPLTVVEDPQGKNKLTKFSYNEVGAVLTKTKADGVVLSYVYDDLGRQIEAHSSDNSVSYHFSYDLNDNMIVSEDLLTGKILRRDFDQFGRLRAEVFPHGNEIRFDYDQYGRVSKVMLPDQSQIEYSFNPVFTQSVSRILPNGSQQFTHEYNFTDFLGRSKETKMISGDEVHFSWDKLGRIKTIETPYVSEKIPEDGYDSVGNLQKISFSKPFQTCFEEYKYDELNQLTFENSCIKHAYQNDSLCNRVQKDGKNNEINSLNQVKRDDAGVSYEYDLNGNLISHKGSDEEIFYQYDAFNRLVEVEKTNQWKIAYIYDSIGRQTEAIKYRWKKGWVKTSHDRYIFQDIHELGSVNSLGQFQELRVIGKNDGAIFRPAVAIELQGRLFAPIYDHRHNLICLVDKETKEPVEYCRYSAYGLTIFEQSNEESDTSIVGNPWLFGSKRYEPLTKLYNFGKRYYKPALGRWITQDPGDFIDGMNLYAYTQNRPMIYSDFLGYKTSSVEGGRHEKGFRSMFSTLYTPIRVAGEYIESAGHHCIPASPVQYAVETAGRVVSNKSIFHEPSFSKKTVSGVMMGKEMPYGMARAITGILCEEQNTIDMAVRTQEHLEGCEVFFTCDRSQGLISDLVTSVLAIFCIDTCAVKELRSTIVNDYERTKARCGDYFYLYYEIHSRGGATFWAATKGLPNVIREHIKSWTYGSAMPLPKEKYHFAKNIVNPKDIVPKVSSIFNLFGLKDNIDVTDHKSDSIFAPIEDHFMDQYDHELETSCNDILKEQGLSE